jgi:hypothetical protein
LPARMNQPINCWTPAEFCLTIGHLFGFTNNVMVWLEHCPLHIIWCVTADVDGLFVTQKKEALPHITWSILTMFLQRCCSTGCHAYKKKGWVSRREVPFARSSADTEIPHFN